MPKVTSIHHGRRAVLKAIGLATAGVAVPPMAFGFGGAAPAAAPATMLAGARAAVRVSVLLPSSQFDGASAAASAFSDGFALGLEAAAAGQVTAQVHDIGGGVSRAMAFARGQAARRDTDVVVAMMGARSALWMRSDLEAAGIPLMVANAGERVVRSDAVSPSFVYSSLELTRAAYASGRWAAEQGGRRCALACSHYESGFDMLPAFRAGFEAAGGTVVLSVVSDGPTDAIDAGAAAHALARSGADVVAGYYTGADAREFFASWASIAGSRSRLVVAGPMVTADEASGVELTSVASWSPELPVAANRAFVASFTDRFRRAPDQFAMLGHETARMVRDAAPGGARSLADSLRRTGFSGARGAMAMDTRTNELSAPLFLRRIGAGGEESLTGLTPASAVVRLADALPTQRGWTTSYMTA